MTPTVPGAGPPVPPSDGRRSRWIEHRRARREDLVAAAVDAVRRVGPGLAVEDVARSAGVSKTVIYRYFGDKDELIDAVVERIAQAILLPRLLGQLAADHPDDRTALRAVIAAFVSLIEEEPQLYRFGYAQAGHSGQADLVADAERAVGQALENHLGARLLDAGRPTEPAMTWAYGIVGMVQLAAHRWSDTRHVPSSDLVDHLTELAYGGLGALLPERRTSSPA